MFSAAIKDVVRCSYICHYGTWVNLNQFKDNEVGFFFEVQLYQNLVCIKGKVVFTKKKFLQIFDAVNLKILFDDFKGHYFKLITR